MRPRATCHKIVFLSAFWASLTFFFCFLHNILEMHTTPPLPVNLAVSPRCIQMSRKQNTDSTEVTNSSFFTELLISLHFLRLFFFKLSVQLGQMYIDVISKSQVQNMLLGGWFISFTCLFPSFYLFIPSGEITAFDPLSIILLNILGESIFHICLWKSAPHHTDIWH